MLLKDTEDKLIRGEFRKLLMNAMVVRRIVAMYISHEIMQSRGGWSYCGGGGRRQPWPISHIMVFCANYRLRQG